MRYMTIAAFAGAVALAVGCGGGKATENCVKMLACDTALAASEAEYTATFDGLDDAAWGDGGTCYKGDKDACDAACSSSFDGLKTAAAAFVTSEAIEAVPSECE